MSVSETRETTSLQWKNRDDDNVVVWHKEAFAQGACRNAHIGFYTDKHRYQPAGRKCVVKMFKHQICWSADKWDQDIRGMKKAKELADEWNDLNLISKRIEVLTGEVLQQKTGQPHLIGQYVLVEPFVEGDYQKWNSNSGWVFDDRLSVQAFCHWTYHTTGGQLLFCDAQGVRLDDRYVVTDPCIMSHTPGKFGMTDGGREMQLDWLRNHKCNEFCDPSWPCACGASRRAPVRQSMYVWQVAPTKPRRK